MSWRVAESLEVLRRQFNSRYPTRSKVSDGGIGDAAHASRSSDHNPWYRKGGLGVVTARDFTHDSGVGMDIDRLTDELAASRDPRIKYIIANGLILDSRPGNNPWRWMPYRGSNPHTKHFHLSVMPHLCDDSRPWNLPSFGGAPAPAPNPRPEEGFLMALSDREQYDLKKQVLDLHKLFYEAGFVQNKLDPKNPTKGADMLSDIAVWANHGLRQSVRAANAAETAAAELTEQRPSGVNPNIAFTQGEYAVFSDKNDYDNAKRLERLEAKFDKLVEAFEAHAKVYTEDK